MFPIRMLFSVATAGLLVLGASLAASQQQAAGGLQRPDQAETKPQADDLSQKGVVIHAEPENLQETPKSEVIVDVAGVQPGYSNFCRVTATPEEVMLDFGFNAQPFATGAPQVKANQRIALNFYTAKRLMVALETTIRRHEQTFGAIELDVRRRTKSFQQRQQGGDLRK
ncbi:MAG: DUF3467 domain-containing protein [Isosphaeraceae bacterium]|jgi:hypothetical protein